MVVLTEHLVISKGRSDNISTVRNLNLWGNDLTDVSVIRKMTGVEILSLSVNRINTLKDFQYCPKLQELYLRKNEISNLYEVKYLSKNSNLKILWLSDNPCAEDSNYRLYVIKNIPSLRKLDNSDVTNEERMQSLSVEIDGDDINNSGIDEDKFSSPPTAQPSVAPSRGRPALADRPSWQQGQAELNAVSEHIRNSFLPEKDAISYGGGSVIPPERESQRERERERERENQRDRGRGGEVVVGGGGAGLDRARERERERERDRESISARSERERENIIGGMGGMAVRERESVSRSDRERERESVREREREREPAQSAIRRDLREKEVPRKNSNVLYAVLTLLNELDPESLGIVRAEIENKLQK